MAGLVNKILQSLSQDVKEALKNPITLFLYRYLVLRPQMKRVSGITIELTDRCNLSCSYCPKGQGIGVRGGSMDFDLFKKIVDEAYDLIKIRQVALVGFGEPLMYPELDEAIFYIKHKDPSIRVSVTSNACLLNSDRGKRLLETGLDWITLSINAFSREKYHQLNNADKYETVVQNIKYFLHCANNSSTGIRVAVQILNGLNSPAEIKAFRQFWKPYLGKCGVIQIQPFINWGGLIKQPPKSLDQPAVKEGANSVNHRYPCVHLQQSWIVSREGEALPCCAVFPRRQGDLALGNVQEKTLKNLFMEGRIVELRKLNKNGLLYRLNPCNKCDHYKSYPNVFIRNPLFPYIGDRWL